MICVAGTVLKLGYSSKAMEAYGTTTREAIARFLDHKLGFADCIAALNAALADLIPRLTSQQLVHLRAVMLANNEIVMKELNGAGRHAKIQSKFPPVQHVILSWVVSLLEDPAESGAWRKRRFRS